MNIEQIDVRGSIRLGQFVKLSGLTGSGAEATACIKEGLIAVDGEVCTARSRQLKHGQIVTVLDDAAPFAAQVNVIDSSL